MCCDQIHVSRRGFYGCVEINRNRVPSEKKGEGKSDEREWWFGSMVFI